MPARCNVADNLWARPRELADEKKAGPHFVPRKQSEQRGSGCGIGAIIERKREHGTARRIADCAPKQL